MAATDHLRNAALQCLDRQEEDNRGKLERSQAYVKAKEREYKEIKAEFERAFRADMALKGVVQSNATKISERRRRLDAGEANGHDELLQPLILEDIEMPGPVAPSRPSKKKGIAKKPRSSSKKSQSDQDDLQYKPHTKQAAERKAGRTRRLRSDVSDKDISDELGAVKDEDVVEIPNADDIEGTDLGERESSAETVLSHITVARKHSNGTTPAAENPELPSLPFDQQFDQRFEQPGDMDSDEEQRRFEDAMQWANEPLPDLGLYTMPGGLDTDALEERGKSGGLQSEEARSRAASPAESIATSSSSGLFVSERPRRGTSTPRPYREPSPSMLERGNNSPERKPSPPFFTSDERRLSRPATHEAGQSTLMLPPELRTVHAGSQEDDLFGETLSENPQSPMDIDQDPTQLPTPEPSGVHLHSREPSERQRSNELSISAKRGSTDAFEHTQEEPVKKKAVKKKSFLEKMLARGR